MLTTLIVPSTSPPSASVAPKISISNASNHNIGSQRRCVSQNSRAMMAEVPPTEWLMSCCMLVAISSTKTGRPV